MEIFEPVPENQFTENKGEATPDMQVPEAPHMDIDNPIHGEPIIEAPIAEVAPLAAPPVGPVLKVLGLGGGGSNAVDRMIELGVEGVEFIAANTDHQSLAKSLAPVKVQLGPQLTRGLGAGGDPEVGYAAAKESRAELEAALRGADMVFLTAGMGGGTGTGAIAVASEVARAVGAVTIAVVTTPFGFEMGKRQQNAQKGLARLQPHTDTLIAIPNDRLLYVAPHDLPIDVAFRMADDVLRQSVQGIAELVTQPGLINVDFAHVRNMMKRGGGALMAIGHGQGEEKTFHAIQQALNHPLLESISLKDAAGVICNFSGGQDLSLYEVGEAISHIRELTGDDVEVVMGLTSDDRMEDRAQVILIITGLGANALKDLVPDDELDPYGKQAVMEADDELNVTDTLEDTEPAITRVDLQSERMPAAALNNLDIPAFLRKRARAGLAREGQN
ncbi:MAG: cell division protein FtsZ [Chloroflexi bacterium]|nr:cell division protein FtsZ [Chloroflexota bacterium]